MAHAVDRAQIDPVRPAAQQFLRHQVHRIVALRGHHLGQGGFIFAASRNFQKIAALSPHDSKLNAAGIQRYLTDRAALHEAAQQATAGAATPEEKLRKLYARAQQVRNLTFEPRKPEQEERELRDNRSSIDVPSR